MLLNGREIIVNESYGEPYLLGSRYKDDSFAKEALRGEIETDAVSDVFFSKTNIQALQDGIRYKVYIESADRQLIIDRQSDTDLLLIMKGIYLEHSKFLRDADVVRQVRRLNEKVLAYVVPRIMMELSMYIKYRQDVSSMPTPMDRPSNMSTKGDRQLERKRF